MRKFHVMMLKDLKNTVTKKQMWDVFLNSIYGHTCLYKLVMLMGRRWRRTGAVFWEGERKPGSGRRTGLGFRSLGCCSKR